MRRLGASSVSAPAPLPWWMPFLAGAAAGLAAGVVLGGRGRGAGAHPGDDPDAGGGGRAPRADEDPWTERAWTGAVRSLEQARELLSRPVPLDLGALRRRVETLPSGEGVRVRILGDGIVEVVGSAADAAAARALLDAVAEEPGVEIVVNRVWTPSSTVRNLSG